MKITLSAILGGKMLLEILTGWGGSATNTVRQQMWPSGPSSTLDIGRDAQAHSECSLDSPTPGTRVTIADPSGTVIGIAALGLWVRTMASAGGHILFEAIRDSRPFLQADPKLFGVAHLLSPPSGR